MSSGADDVLDDLSFCTANIISSSLVYEDKLGLRAVHVTDLLQWFINEEPTHMISYETANDKSNGQGSGLESATSPYFVRDCLHDSQNGRRL